MITIIWSISIVLSIPYLVSTDVSYWDYTIMSGICINMRINMGRNKKGDIPMFDMINQNRYIVSITRLIFIICEFIIPTSVVAIFSGLILIHLLKLYLDKSAEKVRSNSNSSVNGCEITKRLIFILLIFINKNTTFVLVTGRLHQIFRNSQPCQSSISSGSFWPFFLYEIYRISTTLNSFIYFWMSSDFRKKCRIILFKCI